MTNRVKPSCRKPSCRKSSEKKLKHTVNGKNHKAVNQPSVSLLSFVSFLFFSFDKLGIEQLLRKNKVTTEFTHVKSEVTS